MLCLSGVTRILSQEEHSEIRQESRKFPHKYNKLENVTDSVYNSVCEFVAITGNMWCSIYQSATAHWSYT